MRRIHLFVMLMFLVSCDKGKHNGEEKAEIPYWGDSAVIHISGKIDGTKATVYLDGRK